MSEHPSQTQHSTKENVAAIGVVALALGFCCGLPLIVVLAATVAAGTLLGVGAGVLGAAAVAGVIVLLVRARRRACEPRLTRAPDAANASRGTAERPGANGVGTAARRHAPSGMRRF